MNSQDRVEVSQESSGGVNSATAMAAPSTIATTKMKASAHIIDEGSTMEVGQSGSMILVQDDNKD